MFQFFNLYLTGFLFILTAQEVFCNYDALSNRESSALGIFPHLTSQNLKFQKASYSTYNTTQISIIQTASYSRKATIPPGNTEIVEFHQKLIEVSNLILIENKFNIIKFF